MSAPQKFTAPFTGKGERLELMKTFIKAYWETYHFSPDNKEIATHLGGLSNSTIHYYRERLEHDGWLEVHPPHTARSWVPVEIFRDRPVFATHIVVPDNMDMLDYDGREPGGRSG